MLWGKRYTYNFIRDVRLLVLGSEFALDLRRSNHTPLYTHLVWMMIGKKVRAIAQFSSHSKFKIVYCFESVISFSIETMLSHNQFIV